MGDNDVAWLRFHLDAEQVVGPSGEKIGISTADLVAFSRFCDEVAEVVAERASWRFMAALEVPTEQRMAALAKMSRRPAAHSLSQVSALASGSLIVVVGLGAAYLAARVLENLLGGTVKDAWQESAMGERARHALRDGLFGGAAEAVEQVAANSRLAGPLEVADIQVAGEAASEKGAEIGIAVKKTRTPELDAIRNHEFLFDGPVGSTPSFEYTAIRKPMAMKDEPVTMEDETFGIG